MTVSASQEPSTISTPQQAGKRKSERKHENGAKQNHEDGDAVSVSQEIAKRELKRRNIEKRCVHEVAVPPGYVSTLEESVHGTISEPVYRGNMAKTYPFNLDPFQKISVACLERKESVLVSAHTSAGKTAVAEYAIAMSLRDKQRVIYTSPLKALSNQKYRELSFEFKDVGLMTGDTTICPNASCLVMTTEILRAMLFRTSEVLKEVAWVIFDEIHYMKDRERGVVWEESIIFLPPQIKMVFLSATMSNATEFAQWICYLHKQPCHVVYTDFRPTPLQHYIYPSGGSGIYLVVDEKEQFRDNNFSKAMASISKSALDDNSVVKTSNLSSMDRTVEDTQKILKMIMDRKFQPVIIFSFSRRKCEEYAMAMSEFDFNSEEEKADVEHIFENAIFCLNEEDRALPAVQLILPLLKRGIAVHHSGLLSIIKELVELLFQEGLIKALFATETFAMGLNMPAKTVVFTALGKFDGEQNRLMTSGEYIQMSGRAGRRGKDPRGICIIMVGKEVNMDAFKEIIMGKPAPLVSNFQLSYYTLLNLLSRAEGQFDAEHVIRNSFHQFQHEQGLPEVRDKIMKLEHEVALLDAVDRAPLAEYHNLRLKISHLEKQLMTEIARPERILRLLAPGRMVKVREGTTDWGWGVIVNVGKKPTSRTSTLPSDASHSTHYLLDTLLICIPTSTDDGLRPMPSDLPSGEMAEMHVVPVQLSHICGISSLRVALPQDLREPEARRRVLMAVKELEKQYLKGLPRLDPVEDMGINKPEIIKIQNELNDAEKQLFSHPLHTVGQDEHQHLSFKRKAKLRDKIKKLRRKMLDSQGRAEKPFESAEASWTC
eukprot:TRINITY_DN4218_c0_g2_i1.p1 TRINITY_DN4218_c0_g2~~TRINITY_DN4218_c0_g2_i1.p1  ORF type:complete len:828 (+),score=139.42 TRINITY_DN4218_c0_g2_i1:229-2712(+)